MSHFISRSVAVIGLLALIAVAQPIAADPPNPKQKAVDRAVVAALDFLAGEQLPNGSWRADGYGEMTSTTSLAIMAFLAAGHVPGEGPYADHLDRGIRWVISQQKPNGLIINRTSHGPMYCHGISTLMLAEVAGMVPKHLAEPVRKALEKAVKAILQAQDVRKPQRDAGGWRYHITSPDSDLSVTGWQLLALRAAKNIGCDVPAENIDRAVDYVKLCSFRNQGFCYQPGDGPTQVRSGTGILALEICGEHHAPQSLGAAEILRVRPLRYGQPYYFYGVYYCSVGMFQVGGKYWDETRDTVYDQLLPRQLADGSWQSADNSEIQAGRVYCTSMSVLALAVEYQYLPIYQR